MHLPTRLFSIFAVVLVSLGLVLGVSTPAGAVGGITGTITGSITDASTGAPVAGAAVSAASPSGLVKATTDAKGFFSITGVPVDTYTIAYQKQGYEPVSTPGVTVQGDATIDASIALRKSLTTIGRVTSRTATNAYQPNQTTDQYQVSGAQLKTALGKANNVSETNLILSVPGTQSNVNGALALRGSLRTELGYQFEGINYTDPLTSQFVNSLALNGIAALQVVPGAGDASQGNTAAGSVNLVAKRGTRPPFGSLDLESLAFPFSHQLGFEYGWATPDGRFSNYSSFLGSRAETQFGPRASDLVKAGAFLSQSFGVSNDFVNNFIYKFGKDQSRQLQFFYQTRFFDPIFNRGGISNIIDPRNGNLVNLCYKTCDPNVAPQLGAYFPGLTAAQQLSDMQSVIGLLPGQSSPVQNIYYKGFNHQPVDTFKLEYDMQLGSSAYWANRFYRVVSVSTFDRPYDSQTTSSRVNAGQGGFRNGFSGEFTKQANDKNLLTLSYQYEGQRPVFDFVSNTSGLRSLNPALGNAGGYEIADFIAPGLPCPKTDTLGAPIKGCGYLAQFFPGGIPRIPDAAEGSGVFQQYWGAGLRDQLTVNNKLKMDLGLRYEGANFLFGDSTLDRRGTNPRVLEPRLAGSYKLNSDNAVRFSYGRSAQFPPIGDVSNPVNRDYFKAFSGLPSYDVHTGLRAQYCGIKSNQPCADYADQLRWEYATFFTGPEVTPVRPNTYNNYDLSYEHQFKGNVGVKITPFFRRGYDIVTLSQSVIGTDPTTGLAIFGPQTASNLGVEKTSGVEFYLTKDNPVGFSGFLSMTYVNRIQNVPPTFNALEDFFPGLPPASIALGKLYRAGYLSPFVARTGLTYAFKNGFKINPIININKGYPVVGAGKLAATFVNNVPTVVPNTNASVPGVGPISISGTPALVTQYVDPLNPGSVFNPNIAATRGTPEGNDPGAYLSNPRLTADVSFELSPPGNKKLTYGLYVANIFNQIYALPSLNSRYQAVATGIAGPQTGQTAAAQTFGPALGFFNFGPERFGRNAYTFGPNATPISFRFYLQMGF